MCGDPDHGAVQALQREDAEYPGAGICRGARRPPAQTEEAKHGISFTYTYPTFYLLNGTQKVLIVTAAPEYLDGCSWCSAVAPHAESLSS